MIVLPSSLLVSVQFTKKNLKSNVRNTDFQLAKRKQCTRRKTINARTYTIGDTKNFTVDTDPEMVTLILIKKINT